MSEEDDIRYSQKCFSETLQELMAQRKLSYRMMEYLSKLSAGYIHHLATGKQGPSDNSIELLAFGLKIAPEFFLEFRLRRVVEKLEEYPELVDALYDFLWKREFGELDV